MNAAVLATLGAATVVAAGPVPGTISGPITAVSGKTFTVQTPLSPTGSSKVTVGARTQFREQGAGTRADLTKGACVTATGTKSGGTVAAQRIGVVPGAKGRCGGGFRRGDARPRGDNRSGRAFRPPASFGFAAGTVAAVKGSTLTVKGPSGTTTVTVSAKTQIAKTLKVTASALSTKLCAFVRGTSADEGATVTATDVALSKPVGGSCNGFTGRRHPGTR